MDSHLEHPEHVKLTARVRQLVILAVVLVIVALLLTFKYFNQEPAVETIVSYDTRMEVQSNKDILLTETVVYNFSYNKKEGITRYIPLVSQTNPRLEVEVLSVVNDLGEPYRYTASLAEKDVIEVRIGDPVVLVTGTKTYIISYRIKNAVMSRNGVDEIYWNVTGDQWPAEIETSNTMVVIPDPKADVIKIDCFTGPRGTTERSCTHSVAHTDNNTTVLFSTARPMNIIEGFTIFLDFTSVR